MTSTSQQQRLQQQQAIPSINDPKQQEHQQQLQQQLQQLQLQLQQQQQPSIPPSFISSDGHVPTATGNTISPSGPTIPVGPAGTTASTTASAQPYPTITVASATPNNGSTTSINALDGLDHPFPPAHSFTSFHPVSSSESFTAQSDQGTPSTATATAATHTTLSISTSTFPSSTAPSTAATATATATTPPPAPSTLPSTYRSSSDQAGLGPIARPKSMAVEDYDGFHGVGSFPETTGFDSASASALTSQRNSHETAATGQSEDEYSTQISFVYANEKRSGDFHALFRSVPENEKLIEDYGCALQKEILVQGRIHISENHVCFNANIFGWVTILVIAFSEITAIEKRLTAFVIPNAISIVTTTNTKGHFFASFLSRDAAHDLLMAAWRKSFPCAANASAASSAHGNYRHNRYNMTINDDEDSNDAQSFISSARGNSESRKNRHRRSFSNASQTWTGDESNGNWDDDDDTKSNTGILRRGSKRAAVKKLIKDVIAPIIPDDDYLRNGSLSPTSIGKKSGRGRSVSELPPRPTSFDIPRNRDSVVSTRSSFDEISLALPVNRPRSGTESSPKLRSSPTVVATLSKQTTPSSPPPAAVAVTGAEAAHRTPTTCKDGRHYPSQFMLETYPGSIQSMWKLLFDSEFNKNFLTSEAMKGADVQEEPWQQTADGMSTKATRYTKWIGMPIGPKTTKAILTDVVEHRDLDEYVTTVTTTSTPDVPSGGSFTTKCRTCITWAGPNQVQVEVTGGVEFSKSSWIKGQIEKGAAEGLTTHFKELNKSIRKFIAANPNIFAGAGSSSTVNTASAGGAVAIEAKAAMPEGYVVGSRESLPSSVASTRSSGGQGFESQDIAQSKTIPAGTSPSSLGIWSALSKAMEWNHGAASHLAFVSILVIVMFANVYIYLQISSVSSQIERIQNDILYVDPHHYYHHHDQHPDVYHPPSASSPPHHSRTPPSSAGSGWMPSQPRKVLDDIEREERFARDQEEAMWAWLTEREARHRQYRAGKGARADNNERQSAPGPGPAVNVKDEHKLTETEAKLHAKIVQLQERLASLELQGSSITVESRAIEQDLSP